MDLARYKSSLATRRFWAAGEHALLDELLLTSFAGRSLEACRKVDLERLLEAILIQMSRERYETRVTGADAIKYDGETYNSYRGQKVRSCRRAQRTPEWGSALYWYGKKKRTLGSNGTKARFSSSCHYNLASLGLGLHEACMKRA